MELRDVRQAIKAAMQMKPTPSPAGNATVLCVKYNLHGDVIKGNVVSVHKAAWEEVPVYQWEVRERGAFGRRTIYTFMLADGQWANGTLVARTIKGNVAKGTFEVLRTYHPVTIEGLSLS